MTGFLSVGGTAESQRRWGELEAMSVADVTLRETAQRKTAMIREAQKSGVLDATWDPLDVLVFVNQLAASWVDQPGLPAESRARFLESRRAAIVTAVERLFPAQR